MCSFHIFLSILVVMATLFVSSKILIAYFYSRTPKTLLFTVNGNSFWSLIISDNICAKNVSLLCTKLKYVQFSHIFVYFGCHGNAFLCKFGSMATPFAPLKFLLAYLNSPTSKTLPYTQTFSP